MNRKIPVWMTVCITLIVASLVMVGTLKFAQSSYKNLVSGNDDNSVLSKVQSLDEAVKNYFYGEIDGTKITDSLMRGYISALDDRYAAYYSAEETQDISDKQEGKSGGLGITYTTDTATGAILVLYVHSGSAADAAGLQRGDLIIAVDGTAVTADSFDTVVEKFKNDPGTKVSITLRKTDSTEKTVEVELSEYTNQSVFCERSEDGVGYILIMKFDEQTPEQLKNAMEELEKPGALSSVIFDLRGNAGGRVDALERMLDYRLPAGDLIFANYKDGSRRTIFTSDADHALTVPAVLLVDGKTASCAEIFASAMRDSGGCKLYGVKTFGKGIIQTTYKLSDGTSFKFTTSMATTASGMVFNEVGLLPDVTLDNVYTDEFFLSAFDEPAVAAARSGVAAER